MSIKWILPPPEGEPLFDRVAYADAPRFIKRAYGPHRDLFRQRHDCQFVWDYSNRAFVVTSFAGSTSDLASGMHFIPRRVASRAQHNNWLDIGAHIHDQGHLGTARMPGICLGMPQARAWDRLMFDLWQDRYERNPRAGRLRGWWQDGLPRRKCWGVRAASPVLWRPDYDNLMSEWITVCDLGETTQVEVLRA